MAYAEGSGVRVSWFRRWRRTIFITIGVLFVAWIATGFYANWYHANERKTADAVAYIQAQKITMSDVDGKHLPPIPDPKVADATVEGVDANDNGIRDDVELAIFNTYPDSLKLRAAAMQYALTQEMFLGAVFDQETWKVADAEAARAIKCAREIEENSNRVVNLTVTVKGFVFNTDRRKNLREATAKYITSSGTITGTACDVEVI